MASLKQSAGDGVVSDSITQNLQRMSLPERQTGYPLRAGHLSVRDLVDLYLTDYAGQDRSRVQRLTWWVATVGDLSLDELTDDHVHAALEKLADQPARYYLGKDAFGASIFKSKGRPL